MPGSHQCARGQITNSILIPCIRRASPLLHRTAKTTARASLKPGHSTTEHQVHRRAAYAARCDERRQIAGSLDSCPTWSSRS
eukprot:3561126-Rhodomonas_salina.2